MKTKKIILIALILAIIAIIVILLGNKKPNVPSGGDPVLIKENAVLKIADTTAEGRETEVICDVTLSGLEDELYPAASFVIDFDKTKLEFISVDEGNILIPSDTGEELPKWSFNVDKANEEGQIKTMYLDITGGMKAFSDEYIPENGILFRLRFRVRGGAEIGEEIPLVFSDAVFAANDESKSLSMTSGTLKANGGFIKIGG